MVAILPKYYVAFSLIVTWVFSKKCNSNKCNMEGKIVGGFETTSTKFPHVAFLLINDDMGTAICGSSILNQWVLLSAAHCITSDVYAYIGHEDLEQIDTIRHIDRSITHENYDSEKIVNDIALLFMGCSVRFSPVVKRVTLSSVFPLDEREAKVAGWGMVNDLKKETSMILKGTKQKIINFEECTKYRAPGPGTMCAGDPDSYTDRPSEGDSGSGLITSKYQLIGLVSFRRNQMPGLVFYTNVSYYYYWIQEATEKNICVD